MDQSDCFLVSDFRPASRYPWGNFPDVARNGDLGELKAQPEYAAAKSGDDAAALEMANRLVRPEFVEAIARLGKDHPMPVLLPVLAVESAGKNRIPLMLASVVGDHLGWPVETSIAQMSRSFKTNSGADHRLTVRTVFDGKIAKDAGYILVDDTLTMGGTIADLRGFVLSRGGQVLGAGVGVAHQGAVHLPIRDKMIHSIEAKHGYEAVQAFAQEQWGYGIECLTQGEAGHVRAAVSLDALRGRFAAARDAIQLRVGKARIAAPASGTSQQESAEEVTQPEQPPASVRDAAQSSQLRNDTPILNGGDTDLSYGGDQQEWIRSDAFRGSGVAESMFIECLGGGIDFGYLSAEDARSIRRQAGPIRLLRNDLQHIEERHGDQIRQAGYNHIIEFVEQAAKCFNGIYRGDKGTLFLVTDIDDSPARNVIVRLTQMPDKESDFWAIKTAAIMRRDYFKGRELLLVRDSPYHTQAPETEAPFSVRPRADKIRLYAGDAAVKGPSKEGSLLEQDGPILFSFQYPFNPGTKVDVPGLNNRTEPVKAAEHDSPHVFHTAKEQKDMAQEQTPIFTYGPMKLRRDPETQALQVSNADTGMDATIPADDPLHKQILKTIEKNPYSKGFVANQVHALVENDGRFVSPELDGDGLVFGPSRVQEQDKSGMEVTEIDLNSPEGRALLAEMGDRLKQPKEYDISTPEVPAVAMDADKLMQRAEPQVGVDLSTMRGRLMDASEYQPERYHDGVPEVGLAASDLVMDLTQARSIGIENVEQQPFLHKPTRDPEVNAALENWPSIEGAEKPLFPEAPRPKFERILPPAMLLGDKKGRPHVLDYGDKVTVTNRAMMGGAMGLGKDTQTQRRQAVDVALSAAAKRFGEPVHFQGNETFMRETIAVAIERGIKLEPGNEAAKRMYEMELKKIEVNQLGASKAGPYRAPEKAKVVDKGLGL